MPFKTTKPSPYIGGLILIAATAVIWVPLTPFFPPALLTPFVIMWLARREATRARRVERAELTCRRRTWGF